MSARTAVERYVIDHDPSFIADDAVMYDHGTGEAIIGADAVGSRIYELYNVFFPGAHADVKTMIVGDDAVSLEITFRGRNDGPFLGHPPTGRDVEVPMCIVYRIDDDKIATIDVYWNLPTMLQQLGMST